MKTKEKGEEKGQDREIMDGALKSQKRDEKEKEKEKVKERELFVSQDKGQVKELRQEKQEELHDRWEMGSITSETLFKGQLVQQVGEVPFLPEPVKFRFLHRLLGRPQVVEVGAGGHLGRMAPGFGQGAKGCPFWMCILQHWVGGG